LLALDYSVVKERREKRRKKRRFTKAFLLGILMAGLLVIWGKEGFLPQPRIDHVIPEKYQMLERRT
jgi:hypothetical protein